MGLRDDLEAQLRVSYDRETIEVYGDQLQALGDPRGELIAMDLAIEDSGPTLALETRRAELSAAWLGDTRLDGCTVVRYGFVELDATGADPVDQVRAAFEGRPAAWVRSVTIAGPPMSVASALGVIARAPRPSLVGLAIRQWAEQEQPAVRDPTALIDATPHLRALSVDGRSVLADFSHGNVRSLRVSGFDAIRTLVDGRLAMPELTALDFALHSHLADEQVAPPPLLFATLGVHLPKLVDLDLSRNEPGYRDPRSLGGVTDMVVAANALAIAPQLRTLRMPATTTPLALAKLGERFPGATVST